MIAENIIPNRKADEGFLVGYSINSKAFRVFNSRTRKVEENLHVNFLENKPNIAGTGPEWLFDIDSLTSSMNYQLVSAGNRTNDYAGGQSDDLGCLEQQIKSGDDSENINSTNSFNTASPTVNVAGDKDGNFHSTNDDAYDAIEDYSQMPNQDNTGIFDDTYDDRDEGAEADYNNLEPIISVSPIPSTRANKDHPKDQIIREVHSTVQTRRMIKQSEAGLITFINKQRRTNHKDFQNCLFACFLSQMEPKKVSQALDDESWVEAMQEELLQFKLLNVWTLVDLPNGKKAIGTNGSLETRRTKQELWLGIKPGW
ncbi:putative ribonuclease H-like domain-containing protein [Tanacetum coccineum]